MCICKKCFDKIIFEQDVEYKCADSHCTHIYTHGQKTAHVYSGKCVHA